MTGQQLAQEMAKWAKAGCSIGLPSTFALSWPDPADQALDAGFYRAANDFHPRSDDADEPFIVE